MVGSCECGNELLGSIKCSQFLSSCKLVSSPERKMHYFNAKNNIGYYATIIHFQLNGLVTDIYCPITSELSLVYTREEERKVRREFNS